MPEDRLLHPKSGHSKKVSMLTDLEYRVWTQYLLSADDFGVMKCSASQLKADNDHLENRPSKMLERCLDALVTVGLLRRFEHQGRLFLYSHNWQEYQKVEYPRATNLPKPPADAIEACEEATQALFSKHPGGARRGKGGKDSGHVPNARSEDVPNVSRTCAEDVPTTRAHARADRLTANGSRLEANGSEGVKGEPSAAWLKTLKESYPSEATADSYVVDSAFFEVFAKDERPADVVWAEMQANLESQRRGHQWRIKRMIPRLDRWLTTGAWKQRHDDQPPVDERVSRQTGTTLNAMQNILGRQAS